jgi:hypothetical protein
LANVDVGFHSANCRSGVGSVSVGTNVLAMNVIGKITTNATPCTASRAREERAEQHAHPDHREGEDEEQAVGRGGVDRAVADPPADDIAADRHQQHRQERLEQVRHGVPAEHRAAPDGQRAEAVHGAVRAVGGDRHGHPEGAAEDDRLGEELRDKTLRAAVLDRLPAGEVRRRVIAAVDESFGRLERAFADVDRPAV